MRKLVLGSLTALLAGAGLAGADTPAEMPAPRALGAAPADAGAVPVPLVASGAPVLAGPISPDGAVLVPAGDCLTIDGACGGNYYWWWGGEYLLWWTKKNDLPPLLTVSPAGRPAALPGTPGSFTIGGGSDLDENERSGGRVTLGAWFTEYKGFGIEGNFFFLESKSFDFGSAGGNQIVSRPFFDVLNGRESTKVVATPGVVNGSVAGSTFGECTGSSRLYGGEFNFLVNLCCDCECRVDFLVGYRHLSLEDSLNIRENTASTLGTLATTVTDRFETSSRFNGGQIGARARWQRGRFGFSVHGKVAVGSSHETYTAAGLTTLFFPNLRLTQNLNGGFLATPSTIGSASCDKFAIVPEAGARLSFQVLECLHLFAGYEFLYWSEVARTGENVNRAVNILEVPQIVGGPVNVFPGVLNIRGTDFWAHGLNAGFELRY